MKSRVKKPTKEYCLLMAHHYFVNGYQLLMWDYLFMWAFHEMYMEDYQ
jgi:hypothetical protein